MTYDISTIINHCSNDGQFLEDCVNAVKPFSKNVIVSCLDEFGDGTPEDLTLLSYQVNSLIDDKVKPCIGKVYDEYKEHDLGSRYLHNLQRFLGCHQLKEIGDMPEYILFLDIDEICETDRMLEWLDTEEYKEYGILSFKCYWYFREKCYQAKQWEQCGTMIKTSLITKELLLEAPFERGQFKRTYPNLTKENVLGLDNKPMIHHYSWVRNKKQMLKKVASWGHNSDKDWTSLVEKEFDKEFDGTDFVHGYEYTKLDKLS